MIARYAPQKLAPDTSKLSAGDKKALQKLTEAARLVDHLFMQQYWSGDLALYEKLKKDTSPLGKARLHYFWLNKGPWSALEGQRAFLPDVPAHRPAGANFYPVKERGFRVNTEWIHVNHSPVGYTAYPMPVGANGNIFHINLEMSF